MKKLKTNQFKSRSENSILPIFQNSLFVFLLFIVTVSSANTVPDIKLYDNISNEDIIDLVTSLPSDRDDTIGVNSLFESCGTWDADSNGYPAPSIAGIPTTDCVNASISYVDTRIDDCSSEAYKLVRAWTIVDSCNANTITLHDQNITVGDIVNPVFTVPAIYSVVVPQYNCTIDIDVIPMTVTDECSGWNYTVSYMLTAPVSPLLTPSGDETLGFVIEDIPSTQDTVWVLYVVTDSCGNSSEDIGLVLIDNSLNLGQNAPRIIGPRVTCVNNSEAYSFDVIIGATYDWSLVSGGVINGPSNVAAINVDWGGTSDPGFELSVEVTTVDGCIFTDTIFVLVGIDGGSVALTNNINFSLGASCSLTVTPGMVTAGPLPADGAFEVLLMDDAGNEILDATLTSEHVGWPIMTILRNVCSGNSAMGTTYVFDKMAPVLTCNDIELFCHEVTLDKGPLVNDNCGGVVTTTLIDSNYVSMNCDPDFIAEITKTYIATDQYGNTSTPCSYSIFVKRFPMDDLEAPVDFTIAGSTALVCGSFEVDSQGNPAVSVTGGPTLYGDEIYPTVDQLCGVGIGYTDNIINSSPCNTKIMRTWTIYESWCTLGKLKSFTQVIEIVDLNKPIIVCPSSMNVTTNGASCNATVLLPPISATDDCSSNLTYDVVYPGGSLIGQNGGLVSLPLGSNTIEYTVTDECYNQSVCSFEVIVEDLTPPVAVLYENLTVSLTEDGTAWAPVTMFNAGSFDDCALLKIEAMRMDEGTPCGVVANTFGDNLHFCCADVGTDVMIIVRLTDISGNTNDAMVSVEIQDKTVPQITVPSNQTVDCGYVFDIEDFSAFGTAIVEDACDDSYSELVVANLSICGNGYYERIFTAFDGVTKDTQIINVVLTTPFSYTSITWPEDYYPTDACLDSDLHPDSLLAPYGYPSATISDCQIVGFSFKDKKYTVSNACYKILRTWTATDECSGLGMYALTYQHEQTIMVTNSVAPVITSSCDSVQALSDNCVEGDITLSSTANDDCTPNAELFNTYKIDIFNDNSFETEVIGVGSSMSVTGNYPLGTHAIVWLYEDKCGNVITCKQLFSIINNNQPTAYCHDDISVGLEGMDTDGDGIIDTEMACIPASTFDAGSSHECGYDIRVSFSSDVNDTILCVTCEDIGKYYVELWVTDENGNQDFCTDTLFVQDNNDIEICKENCDLLVLPADNFEVTTCGDDLSPATIGSMPVVPADSPCQNYTFDYDDEIATYTVGDCVFLVRSWTVTFDCGSEEVCEFQQTIIRYNYIAPTISCSANITMSATGSTCMVAVDIPSPIVVSNCNTDVVVINSFNSNGEDASGDYPVGTTTVTYTATDACNNSVLCTMDVQVLDGIDPVCNAQDVTLTTGDNGLLTVLPDDIDNGSFDDCGTISSMTVSPNQFGCNDAGTTVVVTLTVVDNSGNSSSCTANVTIEDGSLPIAKCKPNGTVSFYLDENGDATVDPTDIDNGSTNACGNPVTLSVDITSLDCDDIPNKTIWLTVTSNGESNVCNSRVNVLDTISPICNAQNITINANETINVADVNNGSTDNCTADADLIMSVSPTSFSCTQLGAQTITLTVTDEYGNTSSCTATATVVDNGAPICAAQDITVQLDANGTVSITGADVDDGSTEGCGGGSVTLAVAPSTFDCTNVGANTVTLTVTAGNGQTSTCTSTVTVMDTISPICNAQDITINVNETIDAADVNNGSSDNCTTDADLTLSVVPTSFSCTELGTQTITLTVTDENGNTSTCTATATVIDNGAPICAAQDITVQLDANGTVSITGADVDDGSTEGCGGGSVTLAVAPSTFDCSNVGANTVTLTVTAGNGQTSTCTSTVTVMDTISPICNAQNITINVNETIDVTDVNNGSSDNCTADADLTLSVAPTSFSCTELGTQTITLTVTDENGNTSTCTATATVVDNGAPICAARDITVQLDGSGTVSITGADVDDGSTEGCGGGSVTFAVTPSSFDCSNVGPNTVTLTVTAGNGQTSSCTSTVTVMDTISPICIAQDTSIYLNSLGTFTIDSSYVDDNSSDNCGVSTITISQYTFDCSHVGANTVEMTVTDVNGNVSTCESTVTVIDTIGSSCLTQNITVALDANGLATITAAEIDNGSTGGACGGTVSLAVSPDSFDCTNVGDNIVTLSVTVNGNTTTCTAIVTITEDINPIITCPGDFTLTCVDYTDNYASFGVATATDNCDTSVDISETVVESLNSCDIGTVTRTFIATDDAGNADTCTQVLVFELGDDPLANADIVFPTTPITVFNCGSIDPADTGAPIVNTQDADCSAVSVNFSDSVNGDGTGCDDIITRTWTVLDTCQMDGSGAGVFTFIQIINAIDNEAPVIVGPADVVMDLTVPNCDGFVDLSNVTVTDCHSVTVTNTSPFADDNNSADASGTYEEGVTVFEIIAIDECGNESRDTVSVTIQSVDNEFTCLKIFFTMDDDLEVLINAFQFVDVVYGCAYENGDLTFSFSNTDENEFLDTLFCDDLGFDVNLDIYAYLNGVLIDSCSTIAHLTDPSGFCTTSLVPGVIGKIYTSKIENVQGVSVGLKGEEEASYMTNEYGVYKFMEVNKGATYNIVPFKDDDHLNGVSTLDLILIQRHILGLKKFEEPYQMIAADINHNGKINALDLINLRKILLGKTKVFKGNTSWRFIDANYNDWDMATILDDYMPEQYYIDALNNMMYVNWLGIKVGDVDGSVKPNEFVSNPDTRFKETNILVVENRVVKEGEEFTIELSSDKQQDIAGFQFTLSYNPSMVEYASLVSSKIGVTEENIGDQYAERGQLAISWNDINDVRLDNGEDIVSLKFTAKKDMKLSECFSINSSMLNAEWYEGTTKSLKLVFNDAKDASVQLISNVPNPWTNQTDISFFLPMEMDVEFTVYDISGRKLISKKDKYNSGLNTITLDRSDLSVDGVLYYEIKTSNTKIIKKMILLSK